MSQLSDEEIYQEVGKIVTKFNLYKCDVCATAVMQWLRENGIEGKIIFIKTTKRKEYYILSKRLEGRGINESITLNGKHYGVEVRGRVFDNLSMDGLTREDWIDDFSCPSEQFIIQELPEL
ncbi:MAG: papain fold toxin domain-containing protein [Nostoc sp.]|uniref:papain fold toxin domain-containing protein n=1 Tax=Nostoc sp. TaxID=1180 RepID=UPI002FFBEA96